MKEETMRRSEGEDSQGIYTRNHPGLPRAILVALVNGIWENQETETKQCVIRILPETERVCGFEFGHEDARLAEATRRGTHDLRDTDEEGIKKALVLLGDFQALGISIKKIKKEPCDQPEEDKAGMTDNSQKIHQKDFIHSYI